MITRTKVGFYLLCLLLCLSQAAFSQNPRIDSLKQALANTHDPEKAYELYRELTSAYIHVNNLESRRYAERTLAFSRVANNPLNLAYDYYKLGASYFYLGNADTALLYADSVDWVLASYPVDSVELKNSIMQAACYRAKGDFTEAVKRNMKGLGLAKKINRQDSEAAILNNLGNIFVNIEQTRKGLSHFQSAAKHYQKAGEKNKLSRVYQNIGDAYYELELYDSTNYYLRQSLTLNEKKKPATASLSYFLLGKLFNQIAQADSSWKYLKLALANAQDHKQAKMEVLALNQIGLQEGNEGRFANGRANLELAEEKSRKLGMAVQYAQNIWNRSLLETKAGEHERALGLLREFYTLKDSLFNQEMNSKVAYLEEKFKAEERELEITRLAKVKAENEAILNQQKYLRAVSFSVLLLALLLATFILVSYSRTLKSKRLLAAKNVRLEELNLEATDARISAEAATRAKSAFLANMTHEIRTPINGVIGVTDILQYTTLSDEQNVYIQAIRRSGENLLRIVNEVLDFSKIEAGKMELEETEFNLYDLMDEVLVLFSSQRSDKDLDLACLIDPQLPQTLKGDPHKLRQVLINLIGNAMKFTSEGGVIIRINQLPSMEHKQVMLKVEVEDTGIGITEEQGRRLFQAFNQADAGIAKKFGGTGLGLTISAKLVELMGGKLEFASEYGKGSRFYFEFALSSTSNAEAETQNTLVLQAVTSFWHGKTALIIEKGQWTRQVLSAHLALAGIKPQFAADYTAVEELLQEQPVDLVLYGIDQNEDPAKNLFGFVVDKFNDLDIPVVLLGTMAKIASQREFFPEVDAFLTKPLQRADFFRLLRSLAAGQNIPIAVPAKTNTPNPGKAESELKMNVLLAEDNDVNRMIALRMFSNLGFEPDFATNGKEALAMCEKKEYEMIFMDVNMPEMDGLETTQRLRQKYAGRKRPIIIAVTANAMEGDRKRCLQAGMDDYISKPFRIDEVKESFLKYGLVKKEIWRD